jgi:hypothetical protein
VNAAAKTRRLLGVAALALAAMAILASPALASEGIGSFKTTMIETNEAGFGAFAGVVASAPSGNVFTIETRSGQTDSVEVNPSTKFSQPESGTVTLSSVGAGEHVVVFGHLSHAGAIAQVTEVVIEPKPEEVAALPSLEFFSEGVVLSAPSGESLTIETHDGSLETIAASPATTYARSRPKPGEGASPPTISDIAPGDYLGVAGAASGPSVSAKAIAISTPQAGGHPDLTTEFSLEHPGEPEAAQNVVFDAPTGVFGNPRAATECSASDFALDQCPADSQVGLITLHANYKNNPNYLLGTAPIFTVVPQNGETARFAFIVPVLDIPIAIPVNVRTESTSDYGLRFTVQDISQLTPLAVAKLTFWGFPAEAGHNPERFAKGKPGQPAGCPEAEGTACIVNPTEASIAATPLIDNPTLCTGEELQSSLEVQTYQDPEHRSQAGATYPPIEGCPREKFEPFLQASPTTTATDSASGLNVELGAPQFETKAAEPSEIKAATVTLPEGFTVNPDAADGQSACTEAQANFGSEGPAECPDSSKIGTFSIGTPALPARLEGAVYIGQPKPGDQYRLFEIASGFGINAKLVGSVRPNPQTGQVNVEFPNLPQAPFDDFQLHLFSGERGLLATPNRCSVYTVSATFHPWNSTLAEQTSNQHFGLESGPGGSPCPGQIRPFHPSLLAGTSNSSAGAFSSFTLKLNREDGDQYLGQLGFTMPPGLSADLRGVAYCPDAAIAAAANNAGRTEQAQPSCPASSQIGTTNVAAGPGSHPFHAVGKVYFAGPFQGAPLSLVAVTPALAGPYDYGTVVVRVALHIDQSDAHVVADSETVPSIIGGVPLRLRSIQVNIDKSNFMINPTNCEPLSISSQGVGDQGTAASFSSPFNAVNCSVLPFKPAMKITQLGGKGQTARSKDPSVRFDLTTRPGNANIKSVAVTLPKAFEIDQRHLGNICSKAQLASEHCAGRQAIGTVSTETPLLEKPLEGPAYAVSGFGKLPHIAFILAGQVTLIPEAMSSSVKGGHLKTVVPTVPDAPIGHFHLTLYGGKRGYLTNTRSLCASPAVTTVEYVAQSGKRLTQRVTAKTACKAAAKKTNQKH